MTKVHLAALAAMTGIAGFGSLSQASTFVWNAATGSWDLAANWTPAGPPTSADRAEWSGGSPASSIVNLTDDETAGTLHVVDRAVQFNLNDFTLDFTGADPVTQSGISGHYIKGDDGHAIFNGSGNVNLTGKLIGGYSTSGLFARVTAQAGADVTTQGLQIGAYRGSGIVTVDGAGTVWGSSGPLILGLSGGSPPPTQPRAQLLVTDGGVFNHTMTNSGPASENNRVSISTTGGQNSKIAVDGPGSQFNFLGTYNGNMVIGGSSSNVNVEITNGGVLSSQAPLGLSTNAGTGVNTFDINGTDSKLTAPHITLAGRSPSDAARGPTVVNVGVGGTLEASSSDGGDHGIAVGDRGLLSVQGGALSVPTGKNVTLLNAGVAGAQATLEGFGTIIGGNLLVQGDSIVRPGLSTGTLTLQDGNFNVISSLAQLPFELSTASGAHDRIELLADGKAASIAGAISYTNLDVGSGIDAAGNLDFLLADTISYNTSDVGGGISAGDITSGFDNLESIMAAEGYTRVFNSPPVNPGEYRYHIATNVSGSLDALRLEIAPIPEPASLGLLGLGALMLGRRRRA